MNIKIALGSNKLDVYPKDLTLNYNELKDLLTKYPDTIDPKGMGKYIVPGHFEGQRRKTCNLKCRSLITLDVDFYNSDLTSLESDLAASFTNYGHMPIAPLHTLLKSLESVL